MSQVARFDRVTTDRRRRSASRGTRRCSRSSTPSAPGCHDGTPGPANKSFTITDPETASPDVHLRPARRPGGLHVRRRDAVRLRRVAPVAARPRHARARGVRPRRSPATSRPTSSRRTRATRCSSRSSTRRSSSRARTWATAPSAASHGHAERRASRSPPRSTACSSRWRTTAASSTRARTRPA